MIPLIDQFPSEKIDAKVEKCLVIRAHAGDEDAANELVIAHMREALLYTKRTSLSIDDAERTSLCYKKLMMCVKRFDPSRNTRFFAFCKPALRGQMKRFWETKDVVRNAKEIVSLDMMDEKRHQNFLGHPMGKTMPHKNIAREDDVPETERECITGEVEGPAIDEICNRDQLAAIEKLVRRKLSSDQKMVIALKYRSGLNFPEIGKYLGVTRSMIHAIHREALQIIRDEVARDGRLLEE